MNKLSALASLLLVMFVSACAPAPTPTLVPTVTEVPPTATTVPPTPTATSIPPTATSVPPTATSVPPTPTETPVPPTATPVPPTATPTSTPRPTNTPVPTRTPEIPNGMGAFVVVNWYGQSMKVTIDKQVYDVGSAGGQTKIFLVPGHYTYSANWEDGGYYQGAVDIKLGARYTMTFRE